MFFAFFIHFGRKLEIKVEIHGMCFDSQAILYLRLSECFKRTCIINPFTVQGALKFLSRS